MSIQLPTTSSQYVAPVSAPSVATPDQLSGVAPSNGSVGVSETSVIPPEDVKPVPVEAAAPSVPASPEAAPAANAGAPDITNIVRAAEGKPPLDSAPVTHNFTPSAPVDTAYTDAVAKKKANDPILAYKAEFTAAKKDPLAELITLANEFNLNPTGRHENALKTEFVLSQMTPEQVGQIPALLDQGQLVFTNEGAFVHVKQRSHEMQRNADAPIVEDMLLKHAIAAASLHHQYDVVTNILNRTTMDPLGTLEKTFKDMKAQGSLMNAISGKTNAQTLTPGLESDIRAIAVKADERMQALRKEAENAARDAAAAEAAKAQAAVPAIPAAAQLQPEAPQATAVPAEVGVEPSNSAAVPSVTPELQTTPAVTPSTIPAPAAPWQNVVGGQNALNPANFNPAIRSATPAASLVPGR